jgi:hypothetical protein
MKRRPGEAAVDAEISSGFSPDDPLDALARRVHALLEPPPLPSAPAPVDAGSGRPGRHRPTRLSRSQLRARWKAGKTAMEPYRGAWRPSAMKTPTSPKGNLLCAIGALEDLPPDYSLSTQEVLDGVWAFPSALPWASAYMVVAWKRLQMPDQAEPGPRLLQDLETRARGLFSTRRSAREFINALVSIALGDVPRPQGQPSGLDPAKEKHLFEKLRDWASTVQRRYQTGEIPATAVLFPGVEVGPRRASGWIAIWQHGWPHQWAVTALSLLLDVHEPALQKHLK